MSPKKHLAHRFRGRYQGDEKELEQTAENCSETECLRDLRRPPIPKKGYKARNRVNVNKWVENQPCEPNLPLPRRPDISQARREWGWGQSAATAGWKAANSRQTFPHAGDQCQGKQRTHEAVGEPLASCNQNSSIRSGSGSGSDSCSGSGSGSGCKERYFILFTSMICLS